MRRWLPPAIAVVCAALTFGLVSRRHVPAVFYRLIGEGDALSIAGGVRAIYRVTEPAADFTLEQVAENLRNRTRGGRHPRDVTVTRRGTEITVAILAGGQAELALVHRIPAGGGQLQLRRVIDDDPFLATLAQAARPPVEADLDTWDVESGRRFSVPYLNAPSRAALEAFLAHPDTPRAPPALELMIEDLTREGART